MGILSAIFSPQPRAADWSPMDDRWYTPLDSFGYGQAGVVVSPDTIKKCMVALAAFRFLANSVAVCKPHVIEELPNRDRRPAPRNHYLQRLLRRPDAAMNTFRWVGSQIFRAGLYGNAYSRILPGEDSIAGTLRPLAPGSIRLIGRRSSGELVYRWDGRYDVGDRPAGAPVELGQEEVFHLRGVTSDGLSGEPINQLIANAISIGQAAEKHTATFLRKGSRLAGLVVPIAPIGKPERAELRESLNSDLGGAENTGTFGILPHGVDVKPIASTNRDAQLLELRDFQVGEILRGIGVPGVMVGYAEKTSTYASAKEFFESGGLKHCVLPWVENFESELEWSLLQDDEPLQVKFNMDTLSRPSTWQRIEMLTKASGRPFMTGNEARQIWDLNRSPQADMDEVVMPSNMTGNDSPEAPAPIEGPAPRKQLKPAPADDDENAHAELIALSDRARQLALDVSARVVRREVAAVKGRNGGGAALKYANDPTGWRAWVESFYDEHAEHVASVLHVPDETARVYCAGQAAALVKGGAAVVETWEWTVAPQLAELALRS